MSLRSLIRNHENFEKKINQLIEYGIEIIDDKLPYKTNKRSIEEKAMLLEALLLRSCAFWESFLEKEVVYAIARAPSNFKKQVGLPDNTRLNLKLIRAILFSDKYKDFHDIERSRSYFNKIIRKEMNPFLGITPTQRQKIIFTYKIRNYLSHYSEFSKKKLMEAYKKNCGYRLFKEPGSFLMKEKGKYFENLIHNYTLVSVNMKEKIKGI